MPPTSRSLTFQQAVTAIKAGWPILVALLSGVLWLSFQLSRLNERVAIVETKIDMMRAAQLPDSGHTQTAAK